MTDAARLGGELIYSSEHAQPRLFGWKMKGLAVRLSWTVGDQYNLFEQSALTGQAISALSHYGTLKGVRLSRSDGAPKAVSTGV